MVVKYLNDTGLTHFVEKLKAYFVKTEEGKVLSTNDYTTAEKSKLAGLSNYTLPAATQDTIGGVKPGTNLTVDEAGTLSVSGDTFLTSDSLTGYVQTATLADYIKSADLTAVSDEEIDAMFTEDP